MTTSFSVYHPGLTFATLVLQSVMANGGVIQRLEARRRGSGEPPDDDPDSSATSSPGPTPSPSSSSKSGSTSAKANTSSSSSASPTSSSFLPSTTNSSTSSPSTTDASLSTSPSISPTALPAIGAVRSNMPTPIIVGAVIGSLVVGGLVVLLLITCCRRIRRARKGPDRTLRAIFFSKGQNKQQPQTSPEMSQTQSSPLVAPAIASGLTSNPFITRYSRSFSSNSSPASTSPLVPASNLPGHSNSMTSSSGRSTAHTTTTSELGILQPPRGSPITSASGLLPIIAAAAEAAAEPSPPPSVQLSPLHRSLTMHQKALETDEKGREGQMEIEEIQGVNDPPPEYDA